MILSLPLPLTLSCTPPPPPGGAGAAHRQNYPFWTFICLLLRPQRHVRVEKKAMKKEKFELLKQGVEVACRLEQTSCPYTAKRGFAFVQHKMLLLPEDLVIGMVRDALCSADVSQPPLVSCASCMSRAHLQSSFEHFELSAASAIACQLSWPQT